MADDPVTFTAEIQASGSGGAFVTVPFDVEARWGKKRVPVRATFDGAPYRGTLVRMGAPDHILIVRKDVRAQIGKGPGDTVAVALEEDTAPRTVAVPDDLAAALRAAGVLAAFEALSYTKRREAVESIESAKREATRQRRIAKTVGGLGG